MAYDSIEPHVRYVIRFDINYGKGCSILSFIVISHLLFLLKQDHIRTSLSFVMFGFSSLLGAIACLYLTETLNQPIPDALEDLQSNDTDSISYQRLHNLDEEV